MFGGLPPAPPKGQPTVPIGNHPLQLNALTSEMWVRLQADCPRWFPQNDSACTHFLLDGMQQPTPGCTHAGRPLHLGKLSIPSEDLETFNKKTIALAASQDLMLYVHEIATPIHPMFMDADANEPVTVRLITFMRDITRAAGLSKGLEHSPQLKRLHMDMMGDILIDIYPLMRRRMPEDVEPTWDDVFTIALDPELRFGCGVTDSPLVRLPDSVVLALVTLFEMSIAKLMDGVMRSFYPVSSSDERLYRAHVLCNYSHYLRRPAVSKSKNKDNIATIKFGMHVVYRFMRVDSETSLWIWQGLVDKFSTDFPNTPGDKTPAEWWGTFFDSSQLYSPVGGLRMAYCVKASQCKECSPKTRRACGECNGSGRIHHDRYYGPLCVIDKGNIAQDAWAKRFFEAPTFVVSMTSLRLLPGFAQSKGLVLDGKRPPINMTARHRQRLDQNLGKEKASLTVKKLARQHHIDPDGPRMGSLMEAVNGFIETIPLAHAPKESLRIPLMDTDPRRVAVDRAFSEVVGALFHVACVDVRVRSVTLVLDRPKGEPDHLLVTVRGRGASRCFNRVVDTADTVVAEDLPPELRNKKADDVDGIPGRHTNSTNSVYYVFYRDGRIVQRCGNSQSKESRRSAQKLGERKTAACINWPGETRYMVRPLLDDVLRDMFYTPQEQQDKIKYREEIVKNVAVLSKRLKKNKNRPTSLIGAYATYDEDVKAAVKTFERNKRMPGKPTAAAAAAAMNPESVAWESERGFFSRR